MSEALILQSINPQYDDRLFIDSWLQYKKNTTSEHVVYKHCFLFLFWSSKQCLYTTCSQLVFFLYWIQEWMNNLSSYCGLTDSRISASEKDLPVLTTLFKICLEKGRMSKSRHFPVCVHWRSILLVNHFFLNFSKLKCYCSKFCLDEQEICFDQMF